MSSSRIIATRKRSVFMAHVCSECGFPMITVVQIEAEAQESYTFSQKKAEQIASETAENAINNEIKYIESCYSTKSVLVEKQKKQRDDFSGVFFTSSFSGHISQCPKCLNVEPWKAASSKKSMSELYKKNFPTVFTDPDKAEKWAFDIINSMVRECMMKHMDASIAQEAVEKVIDSKIRINAWLKEINSIPEEPERNRLKVELSNAEKLKSQLGIFDFKNKKIISEKIKILRLQIKDLDRIIENKNSPILEKIVKLKNELLVTQSIAFGCTGDVLSEKRGNAISFFISPNDIPDDVLRRIDDSIESTLKIVTDFKAESLSEVESCLDVEKPVFCRKCGYKLLADSLFCTKCGTKVE